MFHKVDDPNFITGEHDMLRFWAEHDVFGKLEAQNADKPHWSFLDGPITANNPMGVHHAWGRTYKDAFQRYRAMTGRKLRYQNGFDCQGLWVEVEVEKELNLGTKTGIADYGIDRFVRACKKRVLNFAARQTEQSVRLGYWMEWDDPGELRKLADAIGEASRETRDESPEKGSQKESLNSQLSTLDSPLTYTTARGQTVTAPAEQIAAKLGNPEWGGSYFTFSTENNETIWSFLKKCYKRDKIYMGHDVMPWSGRAGSAYSQMEVADGRNLTTHRSCFVRFRIIDRPVLAPGESPGDGSAESPESNEFLLVWTTTPWTLTSNVACAVNPDLEYVKLRAKKDGAVYYFAKDNLEYKRLEKEFKEGFGRPEWSWPEGVGKLKTIAQIFKEQGGYEIEGTIKGADMIGWRYEGVFDDLNAQMQPAGVPKDKNSESRAANWKGRIPNPDATTDVRDEYRQQLLSLARGAIDSEVQSAARWHEAVEQCTIRLQHLLGRAHSLGFFSDIGLFPDSRLKEIDESFRKLGLNVASSDDWQRLFSFIRFEDSTADLSSLDHCSDLYGSALAVFDALNDELSRFPTRSAADSHRIIDGGRDSKGNATVVAGEGTGIVHIAPGCGDVDHTIGKQLGLPIIAPLAEDGTFGDGFGPFTGQRASDPDTAQMVFDSLKDKGLLVAVETYPHIYPFCWRTGDELVFRLVDEWFINMDWREEIKEVVDTIDWLPPSIEGREREREWLTNMRDWMISKKRFWGLALPIWVNPDDPTDFEVIGSLAELKDRAVEGWDEFEGHTPHRPWIDAVKIKSEKTGAVLSRIVDVGNPWLDAGIVPFSTLNYNEWKNGQESSVQSPVEESSSAPSHSSLVTGHSSLQWSDWYPPEFVVECFPGQFRNWFYSLLALSTMMRYDETNDPKEKRPFQTLLGHRLVMNEEGQPMHKSDGTAIWFEEAAEQLGVDTLRWLYLAQDPSSDLRFGTRHPEEPVTLPTVDGPITHTREGLPCVKVTSKPADEIRRQILIPLWNSYAFFVNYARLDGFDPSLPAVPVAERPEIDRWILSNLQTFLQTANDRFCAFDAATVCKAATTFIDDLSNWYIRRNRRRFWRSRKEEGVNSENSTKSGKSQNSSHSSDSSHVSYSSWDPDKLAAYQTLYTVLTTLTKALAPIVPFLCERMYQNLMGQGSRTKGQGDESSPSALDPPPSASPVTGHLSLDTPLSVHLCTYPQADETLIDAALNARMATAQRVVSLGLRLRDAQDLRVRQPLAELRYAASDEMAAHIDALADVIDDELNVKQLSRADNLDDLVRYTYKPNLKTLGPKYGKLLNKLRTQIPELGDTVLAPLRSGEPVTTSIDGTEVTLQPEDVLVTTEQSSDWACGDEPGLQIALSTSLTPELVHEGMARDFVRHVQQARKDADLEITDRINVSYSGTAEVTAAVDAWKDYIARETLADAVAQSATPPNDAKTVAIGEAEGTVSIERV